MFTLKINNGNDAFQDGNVSFETARILRSLADKLENDPSDWAGEGVHIALRDANGNTVGVAEGTLD